MTAAVRIRTAASEDRAAIGRLWQELMAFQKPYEMRFRHLTPDALDLWLEHLDDCMADENHIILVAEAGAELVGFATAGPGKDPPLFDVPPYMFVSAFAVTDGWRRRGVGRRLFEAIVECSQERGLGEIRLSVTAGNPVSSAFWREIGFEPYAVHMRRGL